MKKIIGVLLTITIILALFIPNVKASSFKFVVSPSATEVESGSTITISLKVSDIDAGELGINTVKAIFKYDETVFENAQVTSKNNWSITYNNQKNSEKYGTLLAVISAAGVTQDQEIGTIILKVKENTQGKTGNITFTEVSSNDGTNTIPETDKTIPIKVKGQANSESNNQDGNGTGNENGSGTGTGNENGTGNGTGTGSGTTNKQSGTNNIKVQTENLSSGKLPQTGVNETLIVIGIIAIAVAIIIGYIKYKKYKE